MSGYGQDNLGSIGVIISSAMAALQVYLNPTGSMSYAVPQGANQQLRIDLSLSLLSSVSVSAILSWTDPVCGAATYTFEDGSIALPAGPQPLSSILILAQAGTTVTLNLIAGASGQVFAAGSVNLEV
jgi:hypothetical protein